MFGEGDLTLEVESPGSPEAFVSKDQTIENHITPDNV
jgi:hypothetical protein